MKIAYNPSGASPLAGAPENNNDIIFDLAGKAIYVKDVKLLGTDTVYDVFKKHTSSNGGGNVGLVPVPSYTNTNTRFLREDGTWVVPTNTTYEVFTGSTLENSGKAGLVPAPSAGLKRLLLSDGTWTLKFLSYDIPANSAIKITFYSQTHATLFMRHTWSNNMGVYHISGYGSYGDTKRISIVEVTNSCSGIIYPVDGEFAVIIKNPETTNSLFVSATLLLGSISKIETVTSEVTKSDIWRNVLHSANAFIKNGTININGVSITPLTQHLSLSNYVTLDTALVITGYKDFTRQVKISTAGNPLKLTSSTTYCDIVFSITNSDGTTVGSGIVLRGNADFKIFDDGWSNEYTILHSNNYTLYKHSYTNLTGSGTTANLAIVSTGTANGWTLKTLGSNAFDSTKYLPLTGGTLSGDLNFRHLNASVKGYITWTGGTVLQRIQISDNNNTNDAVFTFLLSTNSGTDWADLFTIKDNGNVVAAKFITIGGTSSQFLKGDGSLDSNTYLTSSGTIDYAKKLKYNTQIKTLEDLDGFLEASTFKVATFSSITGPGFAGNDGMVLSIPWASTSYGAQIIIDDNYGVVKIRQKENTTWSNWLTFLTSKNYTSYLPFLNSSDTHATNTSVIYAPSTAGTKDLVLVSNGSGAPSWTNLSNITAGASDRSSYLIMPSISTESSIINYGLRVYQGSGSDWTGDVSSMKYAGILALGDASRGWLLWAQRGDGNIGSLHFRVGNGAASAWNTERIILDNVNSSVSGGGSTWGSSITVNIGGTSATLTMPSNPNTDLNVKQGVSSNSKFRCLLLGTTLYDSAPTSPTETTGQAYITKNIYVNPSNATLYAASFIGNLDWSYITNKPTSFTPSSHSHPTNQITALTGYSKATSAADLATTDTLNAALGKLEYKAATTYSWYKSITDDDTDDIINKWGEIVGFLDSVKEGTDILDEFVTRKTDLVITGKKTFYGDGSTLLTVKRNHESHPTYIHFADENESLGFIGISKDHKPVFHHEQQYTILHAGNSYIKNGVITINGTSITPLTLHLSLTNYVTLNTYLTITGLKLFNTSTNTLPLLIARGGNGESEVLKIGIDDHNATFEYVNDETNNSFLFKLVNTDIENGGEGINANSSLVKFYGDADGSVVIANKFMGQLDKTLTFAAGAFTAKTYNNNTAITVNIPTHTSHLTNNSGFLTLHQSLANYVTLNTDQTITGAKTFTRIIYGNAYNYNENKAGAYLVLNKGGNYLGIGASSSNIQNIVIGESDLSGTWIKEHVTIDTSGHVKATKFIGVSKSGDWYSGRDRATFKTTGYSGGYSPTLSIKTTSGSWELGTYDASSFIDNLIFSYVTDSDYNSDTNESIRIKLPYTKSGTIALTSDITKAAVGLGNVLNTAFYASTATVNGGIWEIAGTKSGATFSIYSPITAGTSGLVLVSNGSGAPVWKTATLLTVGTALKLQSGGGNNNNQTSLVYYKFASYTSEDITLQINLNAFFYVTQYYNSHNFGLLRAEVRFNNNGTSPVTGKFRIEWLVNSGIDPNSVQMSYLVSGNTRTINIYHKLTTNNWDSFKVIKLSDGAWSAESGTDWELHRDVKLTSLPTDEIFTKSVNVAIANTAAPVEYGLLNLCIGVAAGGLTSVTNNVLTTSGVNSDTWFRLILSEPLEVDQYYTLGFYVENVPLSATLWSFRVGEQNNTNWTINITSNGWVWATGYYNGNGNSLELLIDDYSRNFYDSIKISKIVLVKGKLKAYYSPAPINLNNYTSYLGYIGTTAVQASSAAQALTGISSATISGVTSTNTLTISNTSGTGHINFSRGSYNYITMPNGGLLHILPDGVGVSSSNGMAFSSKGLHPATNSAYSLGTSSLRWNNVYSVLGNYSGNLTLQTSSGDSPHLVFLRKALTDDNVDWDMYVTGGIFKLRCNPGTDGVESWKEVLSLNSTNSITTAYGITASTFVKSGSSDSYILLGGGSHKAVSDFLLKSELENLELNSNTTTIEKSLQVTKDWMDTGIKYTDLPATGTYIVQLAVSGANNGTGNMYSCYWSGIMSWYREGTNDSDADEIILHRSGHAYGNTLYLRTIMTTNSDGRHLRLQIAANKDLSAAYTFKFKFKQVI